MNNSIINNIWNHPKTSIAGVLICVTTIVGVLSQQGITLGKAGTGTVVALIGAMAAGFLGLLSKDPSSSGTGAAATGAMIAFLCIMLVAGPVGCTQQQKENVAQEIVNFTPSVISAANTVSATIEMLAPQYALIIAPVTAGFDVVAASVDKAAKDYLANPNQTTLAFLQNEVINLQQNVNTSILQIAQIKDPVSQKLALAAINGLATVVNTILGLVQSISTKTQVAAMAAQVRVTLAQVRPYLDEGDMQASSLRVTQDLALNHLSTPDEFFAAEARAGF
jgi:hypothetical protein